MSQQPHSAGAGRASSPSKSVFRFLGKCLLALGAFVLVTIIAFVLINLRDEALRPETRALQNFEQDPVPDAQNAYYAQLALSAPAEVDAHQRGLEYVRALNALHASHPWPDYERIQDLEARFGIRYTPISKNLSSRCGRDDRDCLAQFLAIQKELRALTREHAAHLTRYRSLYAYPEFQETAAKSLLMPVGIYPMDLQRLAVGGLALRAADGELRAVLIELAQDTTYWRRVLAGASTLITKMVAIAVLNRNYQLLSEILHRHRHQIAPLAAAAPMLTELTAAELSMRNVWRAEASLGIHTVFSLDQQLKQPRNTRMSEGTSLWDTTLDHLPFKPNATANLMAEYWQAMIEESESPAGDILNGAQRLRPRLTELAKIPRWDLVYNPAGKILVAIGAQDPETWLRYSARLHNLKGRVRLVRLQYDLYQSRIPVDRLPAYLAAADHRDPYQNQAMHWDAASGDLYFLGIAEQGDALARDHRIAVKF